MRPSQARKHKSRKRNRPVAAEIPVAKAQVEKPEQPPDSAQLEKSRAVLPKLKELEFHSRANLEKLAELSLTIEEELKQKAFAEAIGAVYSAQERFSIQDREIDRELRSGVRSLVGFRLTPKRTESSIFLQLFPRQ